MMGEQWGITGYNINQAENNKPTNNDPNSQKKVILLSSLVTGGQTLPTKFDLIIDLDERKDKAVGIVVIRRSNKN
jgi:hypothetical protein